MYAQIGSSQRYIFDEFYHIEYFVDNRCSGWADISVSTVWKEIEWTQFYPLTNIPRRLREGLGTLAHIATLELLKQQMGERINKYKVKHRIDITEVRRYHLAAMGLNAGSSEARRKARFFMGCSEPFPEYYRKSVEYLKSRG